MNLEPAPRLPKLPFLVGDAVLLLAAATLAFFSPKPLDTTTVVIVAVLVLLGAALFIFPYIAGYAADSAEAAQREQARVNDQIARLHTATESLARAAAQIKAVEEAVHKAAREAETLPYRMQEKLAEFNEALAAKEDTDRESLERELEELRSGHGEKLRQAAEKIAKATAELAALEAAARQHLAAAEAATAKAHAATHEAGAKLDTQLTAALQQLDAKLTGFKASVAQIQFPVPPLAAPAPAPVAQPESAPVSAPVEPPPPEPIAPVADAVEPAPVAEPAEVSALAPAATEPAVEPTVPAASAEPPKPKKPRAPRKPKPEETLLSMSDTPAESPAAEAPAAPVEHVAPVEPPAPAPEPELASESPAAELAEPSVSASSDVADASEAVSSDNGVESSTSSDGATRLLATAYIGIGNKLFIRGDGPGLSWDKGVPMQFVSIGKWGWFTHDASGPIHCKLYKNDETAAAIGDIVLEAGRHTEVTAVF